jgi:hypothetical protein
MNGGDGFGCDPVLDGVPVARRFAQQSGMLDAAGDAPRWTRFKMLADGAQEQTRSVTRGRSSNSATKQSSTSCSTIAALGDGRYELASGDFAKVIAENAGDAAAAKGQACAARKSSDGDCVSLPFDRDPESTLSLEQSLRRASECNERRS